jgi:cytochrome P450
VLLDGDDHLLARREVQRLFSPGRIRRLADDIHVIVTQAVDEFGREPTGDAVPRLANVISARTLALMLGLRDTDPVRLHNWSRSLANFFAASYRRDHAWAAQDALREMREALVANSDENGVWSLVAGGPGQKLATCSMLLFGGLETTAALMSVSLWYVLGNDLTEVVADPTNVAEAAAIVERVLALYPPLGHVARAATEDTSVGGCPVPSGSLVLVSLTGRDVFAPPECPVTPPAHTSGERRIDHLAFGHAMHYCMGAALARVEAATLLSVFGRRFPRAAVMSHQWGTNRTYRGLAALKLTLDGGG